jgi:hypothetical protein
MTQANDRENGLYLEDLPVGQRFVSETYQISEAQIKAFAQELIRSLFIWTRPRRKPPYLPDWRPVDGTQPQSPCVCL